MLVGGLQKFSLVDYPGKVCATIFTVGCNFRCRYCHNPELVIPEKYAKEISLEEIYSFLESRQNKLDAVCITGGEPTNHNGLIDFVRKIKEMGFLVKLDSNGSRPNMLEKMIDKCLIDYIAMDIKAPLERYEKVVDRQVSLENIKKSIDLVLNSGIGHEFRTTVAKSLISKDDLRNIARQIKGAENYYLQKFVPTKLIDSGLAEEESYSEKEFQELSEELKSFVKNCKVR